MDFHRLTPEPRTISLPELRQALRLPSDAHRDRPYTIANFVTSVDGRATLDGRSAPLSDPGDRATFHALREQVDAVIAGTGTLATERYGRLVPDAEARERRVAAGLAPQPLACVVTRTGEVPWDIPLFSEPDQRVVLFAPKGTVEPHANVEIVALEWTEVTLTTAFRRLHESYGVRHVLCEGGPTLFGVLLREQLTDELFLTLGPKLVGGGSGLTITRAPAELPEPALLHLVWVLERESSLFLRYRVSLEGHRAQ